jgi:hypothetical protein
MNGSLLYTYSLYLNYALPGHSLAKSLKESSQRFSAAGAAPYGSQGADFDFLLVSTFVLRSLTAIVVYLP